MPGDSDLHLLQRQIDKQIVRFDEHVQQQEKKWEVIFQMQHETNRQINNLIQCTERLEKSTTGVVEAYKAANSFGRFVKWFGGIAIVLGVGWAWIKDL